MRRNWLRIIALGFLALYGVGLGHAMLAQHDGDCHDSERCALCTLVFAVALPVVLATTGVLLSIKTLPVLAPVRVAVHTNIHTPWTYRGPPSR
jgi:hypothetical protein